MSGRTCHYGRSLLERALEGGYNFLDAQMATETCTVTCRFQEHLQMMDVIKNPGFFCEFTDVPFKKTANSIEHYEKQLRAHVLNPISERFGIDTSDEALLRAIERHNELCALITEIGDHRKEGQPQYHGLRVPRHTAREPGMPEGAHLALYPRDGGGAAHEGAGPEALVPLPRPALRQRRTTTPASPSS